MRHKSMSTLYRRSSACISSSRTPNSGVTLLVSILLLSSSSSTFVRNTFAASTNSDNLRGNYRISNTVIIDKRSYSSSNCDEGQTIDTALASGWAIGSIDSFFRSSYANTYIKELSFYTDIECENKADLSDAILISSHGDPADAFNPRREWFLDKSQNFYRENTNVDLSSTKSFYVGYWHGNGTNNFLPTQDVKCVQIDFRSVNYNSNVPEKLAISAFVPCKDGSSPMWRDVYFLGGIFRTENIASFDDNYFCKNEQCCNYFTANSSYDNYCWCDPSQQWGDYWCDYQFNNEYCYWDNGDCDDEDDGSNGTGVLLIVLGIFLTLCSFSCVVFGKQSPHPNNSGEDGQSTAGGATESAPSPSAPQILTEEARHNRRLFVLTNIIHKKVLSSRKLDSGANDEILILPHEKPLSLRHFDAVSNGVEMNHESVEHEEEQQVSAESPNRLKDDLYIDTIGSDSIRGFESFKDDSIGPGQEEADGVGGGYTPSSSLFSPKICTICCEEYKKGDDVAWSKNEECHHAYHVDCILEWLMMNHDECPQCRAKFILPPS